jgi:four helix bundle protein
VTETIKKFRFRQFPVYTDARKFNRSVKSMSRKFPKEEDFCLRSQLWRALDSILLNIAEGADRATDKEFAYYLNNAHTSLNEVVACLDLAADANYLKQEECEKFLKEAENLANQLTAFRKKLLS